MERGRFYPAVAADDCDGSRNPGSRGCHLEEAGIGVIVKRMWHKSSRQEAAWPRMEQGEYRSYRAVHPFDERFGVDTSGLVYELPSGHPHDLYNNGYFAVAPSVFHSIMQTLRDRLALNYRRFSFVDVGSGKGRALLLAMDYPFREILGVELSPELDRIARANVARYTGGRPRGPVSSIRGGAAGVEA